MTAASTWRDAEVARQCLEPVDEELLAWLLPLSLATLDVLARLAGVSLTYACARFHALRTLGLVGVRPVQLAAGRPTHLHYLTDLGLAVMALLHGTSPRELASRHRLSGRNLQQLAREAPYLLDIYRLLAALAAAEPGPVLLTAWGHPWRRSFVRRSGRSVATASVPAYAALQHASGRRAEYLLLPDRPSLPVGANRSALAQLIRLQAAEDCRLPLLVVVTSSEARVDHWRALLEDVAGALGEPELWARVETWDALAGAPRDLRCRHVTPKRRTSSTVQPSLAVHQPGRRLRQFVGQPFADDHMFEFSLTADERAVLELVGRHPLLTVAQIAVIRGCSIMAARTRCRTLVKRGLLAWVPLPARAAASCLSLPGEPAAPQGLLLRRAGVAVVAAQLGLPLPEVVRRLGLACQEGRGRAARRGRHLTRIAAHTCGVNRLFVRLVQDVRRQQARWPDAALLDWQPAALCGRLRARPDAYFVYRCSGQEHGAFVEYDRGRDRGREYTRKFDGYREFLDSGAYRELYDGFPTILIVAVDKVVEDRVVRFLQERSGDLEELPVLLTTEQRIAGAAAGLLGPIWRTWQANFHDRQAWPAPAASAGTTRPMGFRRAMP